MNPSLMREAQGGKYLDKEELKQFHDQIYTNYQKVLFGEKTVLFKMKELWTYLAPLFTDSKKYAKKIKKSVYFHAYEEAVEALFTEQEIRRQTQ